MKEKIKVKYFLWIVVITYIYFALAKFAVAESVTFQEFAAQMSSEKIMAGESSRDEINRWMNGEKLDRVEVSETEPERKPESKQVEQVGLIDCNNPAGCIGKLKPDWPACPLCNTPVSLPNSIKRSGSISEDIVSLLEEAKSIDEEIGEIKVKREKDLQERLANAKTFDATYAEKVYTNLQNLVDAYNRTKVYIERGGEDVEGSLISEFIGRKPVWKEKDKFIIYPRPRGSTYQ